MYLCFFFCKKINVEAREFSLTPTFIIEPNLFDIERIRVQSILGFRLRLEQCLLVYTIKNELAQ